MNNSLYLNKYSSLIHALCLCLFALEPAKAVTLNMDLYGEVNVSYDSVDPGGDDWVNNVSRLGLKGKYALTDDLNLVYQLEQEVDVIGGNKDVDTLFKTRNSFIGIAGTFGKAYWGSHDTPLKKAQGKVDLFNDQVGDIKNILVGEVRATDVFAYESPVFADTFSIKTMYVPGDNSFDSSKSLALIYAAGDVTAAVGLDADMRKNDKTTSKTHVYDSTRGSIQYTPGNWKFGAILQSSERQNLVGADSENGYILSTSYKHNQWSFMAQYGKSDIITKDTTSQLLGIEYHFAEKSKVYVYWSKFDSGPEIDVLSSGIEVKF